MTLTKAGRIALRVEGNMWNAYWAEPDTMEGAAFLASVPMVAAQHQEIKDDFMDLCRKVVTTIFREEYGIDAEWPEPPQAAPEHERSGSA